MTMRGRPRPRLATIKLARSAMVGIGFKAQRLAVAARQRLTSDFDWHTVAHNTAQVYLAAKRREREPLPRRPIVEQALPGRSD